MTTTQPTHAQLKEYVQDNMLNYYEFHNAANDDIDTGFYDIDTYIDENYESLVDGWQQEQS